MAVLIIDNYDSFTYNLYHYVCKCGVDAVVKRNDELSVQEIEKYEKIILSPGPGLPSETTLMFDVLKTYNDKKPILGVCLGMQGTAEFFGGKLRNQQRVKHGEQIAVTIDSTAKLYAGLPSAITVGLYHSWCVEEGSLPKELKITGVSSEGVIMSFEHTSLPVYGVQFHPESVMTEHGLKIIQNFID